MVALSDQDPALWRRPLIDEADTYLKRAAGQGPPRSRTLQAAIHATWCARQGLAEPAPWREVLAHYDVLLAHRDDPIVRLNRAVALAEVAGVKPALGEVEAMDPHKLQNFLPYHAVLADLLRRTGRLQEAREAYSTALALAPAPAERRWLEQRQQGLEGSGPRGSGQRGSGLTPPSSLRTSG